MAKKRHTADQIIAKLREAEGEPRKGQIKSAERRISTKQAKKNRDFGGKKAGLGCWR